MADAFISYSSLDRSTAESLCQALEARNLRCFIAPRDMEPGENWPGTLVRAINRCRVFVLLLSNHSNESEEVLREVQRAAAVRRRMIPYRIADVLPNDDLSYFLGIRHWIDAQGSQQQTALEQLIRAIQAQVNADSAPAPAAGQQSSSLKVSEEQVAACRLHLAAAMVEQRDTIVSVKSWKREELPALEHLIAQGVLLRVSSPLAPNEPHVLFLEQSDALAALTERVAVQGSDDAESLLEAADRFEPLSRAIGMYLGRQWLNQADGHLSSADARWLSLLADSPRPCVEAIIERLLSTAWKGEPSIGEGSLPRDDEQRFAKVQPLIDRLISGRQLAALRGCARFAKRLFLDSHQYGSAQWVFDRLALQANALRADSQSSSREMERFRAELANEVGRLLRRRDDAAGAEASFRLALGIASRLQEDTLIGICTNNVARIRLEEGDAHDPERRQAVIDLLQQNVARLQRPDQRPQLAVAYHNLAEAHETHHPELAEHFFQLDCDLCRLGDNLEIQFDGLDRLGVFYSQRNRFEEAIAAHREAVQCSERFFDIRRSARGHANLGRALFGEAREQGRKDMLEQACEHLLQARDWYSTLDEPQQYAPTLETLGRAFFAAGRQVRGVAYLYDACEQYDRWPEGHEIAEQIRAEIAALPSALRGE